MMNHMMGEGIMWGMGESFFTRHLGATGRRAGEIPALPFNCLVTSNALLTIPRHDLHVL
mgnify:CR=1 FL=1